MKSKENRGDITYNTDAYAYAFAVTPYFRNQASLSFMFGGDAGIL